MQNCRISEARIFPSSTAFPDEDDVEARIDRNDCILSIAQIIIYGEINRINSIIVACCHQ